MTTLLLPPRPAARVTRAMLHTLQATIDARDLQTGAHCRRVAALCLFVAGVLDLPLWQICQLERAALLHDIGKLAIPDAILLKPAHLTYDELVTMQTHAAVGAEIVSAVFPELVPIVRAHHEGWDGFGYPDRLASDDIPLLAQIIAVCDSYDAMTEDRVYRRGMTPAYAEQIMREGSGFQWCPGIVEALLSIPLRSEL